MFLISVSYSSNIGMLSKLPYNSMTKYCLPLKADHTAIQDSCLDNSSLLSCKVFFAHCIQYLCNCWLYSLLVQGCDCMSYGNFLCAFHILGLGSDFCQSSNRREQTNSPRSILMEKSKGYKLFSISFSTVLWSVADLCTHDALHNCVRVDTNAVHSIACSVDRELKFLKLSIFFSL